MPVVPRDDIVLADGDDMDLAVPFAHQPHAGLGIAGDGPRRGQLCKLLAGLARQSAVDAGLELPSQGQAQQLGTDPRHRPAGQRLPPCAQLRRRQDRPRRQFVIERSSRHQPASTMR